MEPKAHYLLINWELLKSFQKQIFSTQLPPSFLQLMLIWMQPHISHLLLTFSIYLCLEGGMFFPTGSSIKNSGTKAQTEQEFLFLFLELVLPLLRSHNEAEVACCAREIPK